MSLPALFTILLLASVALAIVALVRQRPATFIFAASQAMVLRSLLRFSEQGRPMSLSYTPQWVFAPNILFTAAMILSISVAMAGACLALPAPKHQWDPRDLPPLPRWALWVLGAYFILVIVSQRWIFSVEYASDEQLVFSAPTGGVQSIMSSALLYEVCRRVWVNEWSAPRGILVVAAVFLLTDFLHGSTGIATGFIVVAAIVLWERGRTRIRTVLRAVAMLALVSGLAMMVRLTRQNVHEAGFAAVENAVDILVSDSAGVGVDTAASGPQFAAHVLDCVALYQNGHSRDWRSLSDPVIFTFEPAFLTGPLGIERPTSAPWELREYFIHLGGISIFGEAYWNGGYLGVFVFLGLVLALCYYCDTRYRSSFVWLVMCLNVAPVLLAGLNYGVSYEFRAVMNALLQLAVFRLILPKWRAAREQSTPVIVGRGLPAVSEPTSRPAG
jgi:hypothetical protein